MVLPGIVGDNGSADRHRFIASNIMTGADALSWALSARSGVLSREVLSVSPSAMITHYGFCHATSIALKGGMDLPMFQPAGSNEEGLFAACLTMSAQPQLVAHLPYATMHLGAKLSATKQVESRNEQLKSMFRLSDVVMSLLPNLPSREHATPDAACKAAGAYFTQLSSLREVDLARVVLRSLARDVTTYLTDVARVVNTLGSHLPELQDLSRQIHASALSTLANSGQDFDLSSMYPNLGTSLSSLGKALLIWSDMKEAALYLSSKGRRLSRTLEPLRFRGDC